ncbi:hypothetical protein NGUA15_03828 [Salmonella enterica]|nr:hypothetical protein NGUA15_03828 [Salmonella enterica]
MNLRTIFSSIAGGHIDYLREDILAVDFHYAGFQRAKVRIAQEIERLLYGRR